MKMSRSIIPIILVFIVIVMLASNTLAQPAISKVTYSPRDGGPDTEYIFTLTFVGDMAPEEIYVIVDDMEYPLQEVDASDQNFSDFKDYYIKTTLPEGSHVLYFKVVSNGTTLRSTAFSLIVERFGAGWEHLDVVLAVGVVGGIFLLPILYLAIIFRRISKDLKRYLDTEKEDSDHSDRIDK